MRLNRTVYSSGSHRRPASPVVSFRPAPLTRCSGKADASAILAEKAEATRRAYAADFALFADWCRIRRNVEPLGASPDTVAAFLAGQASVGVKPSTLTRHLAAIGYAHKLAGLAITSRA